MELGLDRDKLFKLGWLTAFAVGMAYVEAAVVVYLRLLHYPDGFIIEGPASLDAMSRFTYGVELGREVATILMLASVALLIARKRWWERRSLKRSYMLRIKPWPRLLFGSPRLETTRKHL